MISYIKEIQGLFITLTKKVLFLKDYKDLQNQWWISSTFKHFKDLYEPWTWWLITSYSHKTDLRYEKNKRAWTKSTRQDRHFLTKSIDEEKIQMMGVNQKIIQQIKNIKFKVIILSTH